MFEQIFTIGLSKYVSATFFIGIQVKYILFAAPCSPIIEVEVGHEQVYYFTSI